mmetsp:Transcript_40097/g.87539  ORF Transcript_40097/g.87539 Transcript_40097/m.87539 type:complete len:260 (+) Transcript_40097:886-1665(+)
MLLPHRSGTHLAQEALQQDEPTQMLVLPPSSTSWSASSPRFFLLQRPSMHEARRPLTNCYDLCWSLNLLSTTEHFRQHRRVGTSTIFLARWSASVCLLVAAEWSSHRSWCFVCQLRAGSNAAQPAARETRWAAKGGQLAVRQVSTRLRPTTIQIHGVWPADPPVRSHAHAVQTGSPADPPVRSHARAVQTGGPSLPRGMAGVSGQGAGGTLQPALPSTASAAVTLVILREAQQQYAGEPTKLAWALVHSSRHPTLPRTT